MQYQDTTGNEVQYSVGLNIQQKLMHLKGNQSKQVHLSRHILITNQIRKRRKVIKAVDAIKVKNNNIILTAKTTIQQTSKYVFTELPSPNCINS